MIMKNLFNDEIKSNFKPTMSATEAEVRLREAQVRLTEARVLSELAKAKATQLELDTKCEALVYIDTALAEFNAKLKIVAELLHGLAGDITNDLRLSPEQYSAVSARVNHILLELSKIEFVFETSREVDKKAAESHLSKKTARKGKK